MSPRGSSSGWGSTSDLIRYVADRPGHDRRYAVDCTKVKSLGWEPRTAFKDGLRHTVDWYRDNPPGGARIKSGEWREYYARQYAALD